MPPNLPHESPNRYRWPTRVWLVAVYFLLATRLMLFVLRHSVNVLFGDDWGYLTPLFRRDPIWKVFVYEHPPGREGIGLVLDKFLLDWTHWNMRAAAMALAVTMCLAALLALALKKRIFGKLEWADAILLFLFMGLGHYELYLNAPNPSPQVFPLLLAMAYCLCWTVRRPTVRLVLVLLANFLLIFSYYGFFMGLISPLIFGALAIRHYREAARRQAAFELAGFSIAVLSLAFFFVGYNVKRPASCFVFPYHPLYSYLWYPSLMFANMLELKGHGMLPTVVGAAFVALLLLTVLVSGREALRGRPGMRELVIFALASFSLLLSTAATVGRICMPLDYAQSSRYLSYVVPAFIAFYFWLLSARPANWRTLVLTGYLAIAAFCALNLTSLDRGVVYWLTSGKQRWRECYLRLEDRARCNAETSLPGWNGAIEEQLQYLKQNQLNLFSREK